MLPDGLLRWSGLSLLHVDPPAVRQPVYWFTVDDAAGLDPWGLRFMVRDDHGCELPAGPPAGCVAAGTKTVLFFSAPTVSRRASSLVARLHQSREAGTPLAEFTVPNPALGLPSLEPEPLPAVRTVEGLQWTLGEFVSGLAKDFELLRPVGPGERPWAVLRFDVSREGRPVDSWELEGLEIIDGEGGVVKLDESTCSRGSPIRFGFQASPCFDEAWRIRCRVAPSRVEEMAPDELWRAEGIDVSQAKAEPGLESTLRGIRVRLVSVAVERLRTGGTIVVVHVEVYPHGRPWPVPMRCEAMVSGGHKARLVESNRSWGPGDGRSQPTHHEFRFDVPPEVAVPRVDLTFSSPRPRVLEFVARPARPGVGPGVLRRP